MSHMVPILNQKSIVNMTMPLVKMIPRQAAVSKNPRKANEL